MVIPRAEHVHLNVLMKCPAEFSCVSAAVRSVLSVGNATGPDLLHAKLRASCPPLKQGHPYCDWTPIAMILVAMRGNLIIVTMLGSARRGKLLMGRFRTGAPVDRAQRQGQRHHHNGDQSQRNEHVDIAEDRSLALHHLIDNGHAGSG
jgi:hypothetical protein